MTYLPFWAGALALAGVVIFHWFGLHRMMAVSGRFSAFVNRMRRQPGEGVGAARDAPITSAELAAAMRAATAEEFGADAVAALGPPPAASTLPPPSVTKAQSLGTHATFLIGLAVGGAVSALAAGGWAPTAGLGSAAFAHLAGGGVWGTAGVLLFGGVLVGFGTRMASGCTSGHGLCGVSRAQKGSIVATLAFFGVGVLVSLALGALA